MTKTFTQLLKLLAIGLIPFSFSGCQSNPVIPSKNISYQSISDLEPYWRNRILQVEATGKVPIIDMESSITKDQLDEFIPGIIPEMDDLGVALISYDGYQAPKDGRKGYRWSYYVNSLVKAYPNYFIPTANGGSNKNWTQGKGGKPKHFIDQMEKEIQTGQYASMGELEIRHYLSNGQCQRGRTDRNVNIGVTSENVHRLFQLSEQTGVPFVIHLEPEDRLLDGLDKMLSQYPKAKVIWAHFGQLRHPKQQTRFNADYVRALFEKHPNIYFDISAGEPNRTYECTGLSGDTVFWQKDKSGRQTNQIQPEYKKLLTDYSTRFVCGMDYGGHRPDLPFHMRERVQYLRKVMNQLPIEAQKNIGYRNAWKLMTGKGWKI